MRHRFVALDVALECCEVLLPALGLVPAAQKNLRDQVERAVVAVASNLAEGNGRQGRARRHHFDIAYGSSEESSAQLMILRALRALPADVVERSLALQDRCRALTYGAMRKVA